jgi:hypothetical protein
LLFLMTFLLTLDFFTADSRLFAVDSRLFAVDSRLFTLDSRLFTLDSRLLLSTLDFYSRLSTFTLDSRPLLSTLDPRLLDTLLESLFAGYVPTEKGRYIVCQDTMVWNPGKLQSYKIEDLCLMLNCTLPCTNPLSQLH